MCIPVNAQWFTGMSQKTGLALCIHLTDSAAELYSPMQSADPIPASSWSLEGNNLSLECKSIGLKMNLTRRDSTFVGYWKQAFLKEDITFYPGLAETYVTVQPGQFAIFFPWDGHAPCVSDAPEIRKVIFKVKAC